MSTASEPRHSPGETDPRTAETEESGSDILKAIRDQLRELVEYGRYYLTAKADQLKVSVRTAILYGVLAAIGLLVIIGIMIVAGWFIVLGLAGGLAQLFDSVWLGNLVAGAVVLLGSAGAMVLGARRFQIAMRDQTIQRYEKRHREQESRFGHSVDSRAEEATGAADRV